MPYPELFTWWAISISCGIAFLIGVSIYLYMNKRVCKDASQQKGAGRLVKDFFFVWVLLGLLVLYIVSISKGSGVLFAAGNIFFEAILITYLIRNKRK
jgi:Flp pilus assembly protein TadB